MVGGCSQPLHWSITWPPPSLPALSPYVTRAWPVQTSTPSRPPGADPRPGRGARWGGGVGGRFVLPDRPFTMGTRVFHTYPGGGVPLKLDPRGMGGWSERAHPDPATPPASPPSPPQYPARVNPLHARRLRWCELRGSPGTKTHSLRDLTSPSPRNPSASAVKPGIAGGFDTHLPPPSRPKEDSEGQSLEGSESG